MAPLVTQGAAAHQPPPEIGRPPNEPRDHSPAAGYLIGMPLIQVFTSVARPPDGGAALLTDLSLLLSKQFGKPED